MFGVKTAGQLGNTQELEIASELFDRQVIKPYQRIVKDALTSIFTAAGTPTVVSVEEVPPMEPEEATELSEDKLDLSGSCDYLIEMGEEMDEEWELIDARRVDYDEEEKMELCTGTFGQATGEERTG
jgi:hypothetical protein